MADASGRYSSQLFFGNDFWLGSHTLCIELQNRAANEYVPPFEATFYVAKLAIKLHDQLTPTVSISRNIIGFNRKKKNKPRNQFYSIIELDGRQGTGGRPK